MQLIRRTRPFHRALNACTPVAAFFFCALVIACFLPGNAAADDIQPKATEGKTSRMEKLVVQVSDSDPKKWNLALNNIKNVQDALGKDNVDVELVVFGPGIDMLKLESVAGNRVNAAVANGVKVVACENTMEAQRLTKADMLKSISYVSAGVIELMEKQRLGYAYIRP